MGMLKEEALEIEKVFESMDIDKDGQITYNEFLAATIVDMEEDVLQKAFIYIDQDHKGFISTQDLQEAFRRNGRNIKMEVLEQMIKDEGFEESRIEFKSFC